jgi:hypothetical protein
MRQPRGEYIPLNPDIEKAHPPRWPAAATSPPHQWVADPFNVSDEEAPPIPAERLSPSHVFASMGDLYAAIGQRDGEGDQSEMDADEDDGGSSSVLDDELPDPETAVLLDENSPSPLSTMTTTTTTSPYGTYSKVVKKTNRNNSAAIGKIKSPSETPSAASDLDAVAIGALDYEHLMNYFEGLKESAA